MKLSKKQIGITAILVLLLALVRALKGSLFYDPFMGYFEGDFRGRPFPDFESVRLFLSLSFRYLVNSALSLAIVYTVFKDLAMTKFAGVLYVILYVVLIALFFGITAFSENPFLLFYVRRFLVQPLFILLFLPAFYFQKKSV